MIWSNFLQFLVLALSLGAMYALIAIGYTIVYGVLKLINIAHGDFFMLAGFLGMWAAIIYGVPLPAALILGLSVTVLIVILVERIAYKPLRKYKMAAFTSTVAVSMIIQASVIILFTARAKGFPHPAFLEQPIQVGGVIIPAVTPFIIIICVILFVILSLLVNKTKMGVAMRALSNDMEMVQLMGVNIDAVITYTFVISVAYAAAASFLWGLRYPAFDPFIGVVIGMKGFVGAVIGGIGSIAGALVGGFILGVSEILLIGFFPHLTAFRDIIAYVLMILFLLFRPGGIFNVKIREEKV
jgi:branched-chain amino acid transport system permease protein